MRGSDLHPVHFAEILAILLPKWQDTDPYLDDIATVMRNAGDDILVRVADDRIDGVLRTKMHPRRGDPRRVPATFEQLVGPYWSRRDPNADTRILVDLTKLDGASGVAKTLIASALDRFRSRISGRSVPRTPSVCTPTSARARSAAFQPAGRVMRRRMWS